MQPGGPAGPAAGVSLAPMVRARPRRLILLAVVALALVGTALIARARHDDRLGGPEVTSAPGDRRPVMGIAPDTTVTVQLLGSLQKGVPVGNGNFADPFVLIDGTEVYAYATNVQGANIPVSRSVSSDTAEYLGDAMPDLATWTKPGAVWAPSVYRRADGTYVMLYDSIYGITNHQCVGRAVSSSPTGPFVDDSTEPLMCPLDLGGAIDASMVTIDGQPHLVYKADGNCCDLPTSIWTAPLSDDLLSVAGEPTQVLTADQKWEDGVVEGPEMAEIDGTLFLFYSGNDWATEHYAIGYAVCESVTGPCSKPLDQPLHASTADAKGPGGQTVVIGGDTVALGYHAWLPGKVNTRTGERRLYLGEVTVADGLVTFDPYERR